MNRLAGGLLVTLFLLSSPSLGSLVQNTTIDSPRGSLEGTVMDSVTGQPIEGVHVVLVPGQALPEEGVQALLANQKPTVQSPQITTVLPAFVLSGRTLEAERSAHSVLTDARGRFTFLGLKAGTYSLAVRRDGYNFQVYGQKPGSLDALPVDIHDGKTDLAVIRMNPESRISGMVVDLDGNPVGTIPVYLLMAQPWIDVDGQKQFRVAAETLTDSEGRYTLEKFPGGRYYVAAGGFGRRESILVSAATAPGGTRSTVRQPAVQAYPFNYYPGVADVRQAPWIDVSAGSKLELRNFVVTKTELRTIRGRVVDYATGKPPESVRVTLNGRFPFLRTGRDSTEILNSEAYDRTTGVFDFKNLIPGNYRVDAVLPRPGPAERGALPNVSPQSAFQILQLNDADINDVVLTVPNTGRVVGKVVVTDGKALPVAASILPIPLQLMFRPLNPLQPAPVVTAVSTEDGSFEVTSSLEGKYRFSILPLRDNYYVSEARLYGARAMNGILDFSGNTVGELILALSPGGQIKGSVADKKGQLTPQAQGVLLPDPLPDIIPVYKILSADASGHFSVDGVPPGNYRIYVWEGIEPSQFFDRDLLARTHGLALPVRVEKGSIVSASVVMITQ